MAVSPVPAPVGFDPRRMARWVRRGMLIFAVVMGTWFVLQFSSRWVPLGMNTNPDIPPGSWVICDRWSIGLRVGSDVFVKTHFGEMLTRVSAIDGDEIRVKHVSETANMPDSELMGPLSIDDVVAVVVVAFAPDRKQSERGN